MGKKSLQALPKLKEVLSLLKQDTVLKGFNKKKASIIEVICIQLLH